VIVDEAHKLKNQRTRNWRFVRELDPRFLLLLTATPIQNSIEELYNLIYLVRPGLLSTRKSFRAEFVHQRNRRVPRNVERLRDLVGNVMVRSRRSQANIAFTDRNVELVPVALEGEEGELYRQLDAFIRDNYAHLPYFEKGINRLTLMLLERMVTSSPQALAGTIARLLEKGSLPPSFQEGLQRIQDRATQLAMPAKFEAVAKVVDGAKERVLIYTQFRDTQEALCRFLEARGHELFRFHGGLPVKAKDSVVKDFAKRDAAVLVSTDAGAEGRNLQFCRVLINFDLPWNPMKVEQRIGRVHRLGQTRDVDIVNLYYQESIEEYVVRLLTEKIKLFTLVVGELDSILGLARTRADLETEIMDVYMSSDESRELDDRFERLGRHFDRAFRDYDGMKDAQNSIFEADS
jgi:SNF2 family DNA or RNA helicase